MEAQASSPQTTLLILLGASEWPQFPEFQSSQAFANAARGMRDYFLDPRRFGIPVENVLDTFDSNSTSDELDAQIGQFLEQRLAMMKATGQGVRDLLVYFVGHGSFVGRDADFYLAIRRTRMDNPRASGLSMLAFADTLTEKARYLRRIIILDCCFAAAAFSAFQAGPAQLAIGKTIDAFEVKQRRGGFPVKGTTLLCSSGHKSPSLLLSDGSSTMFTKAVLDTLAEGITFQQDRLSLREVKDLAADLLSGTRNAPKPVVLSPDQSEGDIADIPFFPNPYVERERVRRMEEERQRRAMEELARQVEEERVHKVKEEQARLAEEERRRRDEKVAQLRIAETRIASVPGLLSTTKTTPSPSNSIFSSRNSPSLSLRPKLSRRTILIGLVGLGGAAGGIALFTHFPKATVSFSGTHNSYTPSATASKGLLISNRLQWGSDYVSGAPYVFQDPKNPSHLIGFEVEIAQAIAGLMGVLQTQVEVEYDLLAQALATNQFDMVINGWEKSADREKTELFSEPYYRFGQQIIVRKEDARFDNVSPTSIKVLEGMTVGTGGGYLAETIMQGDPKIHIKAYNGTLPFSDLVQKKVDAFFLDSPLAAFYITGIGPDAQLIPELKLLGQPLYSDNFYIAINPHRSEASALLSEINGAIAELKKNGTLKHIYQEWGLWNNDQNTIGIT